MKKYYYLCLVRQDNTIPLIVRDNSVLWALSRASRMLECLVSKSASMRTEMPKGKINGSWHRIGFVKLTNKVKTGKNDEENIDFYLTRTRTTSLPPLTTKKGFMFLNPLLKAKYCADEGDFYSLKFIDEPKYYKCEVDLVLMQTGIGI